MQARRNQEVRQPRTSSQQHLQQPTPFCEWTGRLLGAIGNMTFCSFRQCGFDQSSDVSRHFQESIVMRIVFGKINTGMESHYTKVSRGWKNSSSPPPAQVRETGQGPTEGRRESVEASTQLNATEETFVGNSGKFHEPSGICTSPNSRGNFGCKALWRSSWVRGG